MSKSDGGDFSGTLWRWGFGRRAWEFCGGGGKNEIRERGYGGVGVLREGRRLGKGDLKGLYRVGE